MSYTGHKTSKIKRARKHGFRNRNKTKSGRRTMKNRRNKGRKSVAVSVQR